LIEPHCGGVSHPTGNNFETLNQHAYGKSTSIFPASSATTQSRHLAKPLAAITLWVVKTSRSSDLSDLEEKSLILEEAEMWNSAMGSVTSEGTGVFRMVTPTRRSWVESISKAYDKMF
jgi:hypothetical protein